jgi:hypothetical protein
MDRIVEREHRIGLFDEMYCRGAGTVHLVSASEPRLMVMAPPDLVDRVVVRYRGTRLVVSFRVGSDPMRILGKSIDQVRTIVATDDVSKVVVQGAANLRIGESQENPFTAAALKLISSGSGTISGSLSVKDLSVRMRGLGRGSIDGDVENLDVRVSGIGSLDCMDLVCKTARVNLSSIGNCEVMVLDDLKATVTGTGRLRLRGTAQVTRKGTPTGRIEYLE